MSKQQSIRAAAKPLTAAVLMALATPAAFAAVTATQVPGIGYVVYGKNVTSGTLAAGVGNLPAGATVISAGAAGPVVIQWGGSKPAATSAGTINPNGTAGFNIGQSATVAFGANTKGSATANVGAVLNIDATGNPSQILGTLTDLNASQQLFVANANGIMVGSGAVINAPGGLGLINANENTTNALTLFEGGTAVAIDFTGATGGVSIAAGANLNQVGTGLLVAGAGNVNVNGAFVSQSQTTVYSINDKVPLTVDAGVGGYALQATPASFSAADNAKAAAGAFNALASSAVATSYTKAYYADAQSSSVNLNLGTAQSPYAADTGYANRSTTPAGTGLSVLALGNITVASGANITGVNPYVGSSTIPGHEPTFEWTGMFTNNGILNFGLQTGSALTPSFTPAVLGYVNSGGTNYNAIDTDAFGQTIYGNTSMAMGAGGFVNAASGTLNGGSLWFQGASFSNAGTIQLGQPAPNSVPSLNIGATSGNVNLGGTVNVVDAGTYTGSTMLNALRINAAYTAGQSVNISTALPMVSASTVIEATNVSIANSITMNTKNGSNFDFVPYSYQTAGYAAVSGAFNLASGATIAAANVNLGSGDPSAYGPDAAAYRLLYAMPTTATSTNPIAVPNRSGNAAAYTSFVINGSMQANGIPSGTGLMAFGGTGNVASTADTFNVSGAGSITAGNLIFNNLLGSVNNITTGQILANGFQVNAPQGGTVNISVNAKGAAAQGFNVKVNGNASVDSYDTVAVQTQTPANNFQYAQYLVPANANSNLVVQASGNLTVNAGGLQNPYSISGLPDFFQWPGLIYLQANGGALTANAPIANAYAAQATAGRAGVFLVANNITDNSPIYTNGNAGVVFAAPYNASTNTYAYASTINGINPSVANPNLPTVYYAQPNTNVGNANFSFQVLPTFVNQNGYNQENQTFLTYSPAK
jgi:hypothetical protein